MKRTVILALCLSVVSLQAHAISRYNSESMSCGRTQALVNQEGAVILRYQSQRTPGLPRYDRYVASRSFCRLDERAIASYVPTSDTASCVVLKCAQGTYQPFGDD